MHSTSPIHSLQYLSWVDKLHGATGILPVLNYIHLNNSLLLYSIIFQSLQKSLILLITYKHTTLHSISVKGLFWKFCYDVHGEIACVLNDTFAANIVYFWWHFMPLSLHSVFLQLSLKFYVQLLPSSLSLFSFFEF